ncbi:MAG: hypothetical protein ACOYL6_11655 [Bacteriovoracaceae bacterium]
MDELHSILIKHHAKNKKSDDKISAGSPLPKPTFSEIPDLFFDDILIRFKLTRIEIQVLMFLYRQVWCRPNLYAKYGLTSLLSYSDVAKILDLSVEDLMNSIHNLESYGFMQTVRAGQYLVYRYFTREYDIQFNQSYDEF